MDRDTMRASQQIRGFSMFRKASVIAAGVVAALWLATPLASQRSGDAQLEAACRATEVTEPGSCGCTITKAREASVSDAALASLFKDDGRSRPVDQATYGKFWEVKVRCIADATMARMGISASNPLPGVPANMRPGAPLGGAPAPAAVPGPMATPTPGPTQPAASLGKGSLAFGRSVPVSVDQRNYTFEGKTRTTIAETYTFANFDYEFSYDPAIRDDAALFERAKDAALQDQRRWQQEFERPDSIRPMAGYGWSSSGSLGRLVPVGISGYTNNRPQGQFLGAMLWDAQAGREIGWTDVFEPGLWNGRIRREYCAGLQEQRRERGTQQDTSCPEFDQLLIGFEQGTGGSVALTFTALAYIAGSYAEGPYEVKLPLDAAMLAGVREPYRETLRAGGARSALTLRDRLGEVPKGPPVFDREPECSIEIFLAPDRIGNPRGIEDIRRLIELSPGGRVAVFEAGDLGMDGWRSGVMLDGRFVDLTRVEPAAGEADSGDSFAYSGGGVSVTYVMSQGFTEVSYGGWSHGTLTITKDGMSESMPALSQSFQCT